MGDHHSRVGRADAVATNTVKSQKRRNGASIMCFWGQKKSFNFKQTQEGFVWIRAKESLLLRVQAVQVCRTVSQTVKTTGKICEISQRKIRQKYGLLSFRGIIDAKT